MHVIAIYLSFLELKSFLACLKNSEGDNSIFLKTSYTHASAVCSTVLEPWLALNVTMGASQPQNRILLEVLISSFLARAVQ